MRLLRSLPLAFDGPRGRHLPEVREHGRCGGAGRGRSGGPRAEKDEEPLPPIPWHLKLLAVALVVYLSYRLYQGIVWVLG